MSRRKQPGQGTRVLVATVLLVAIGGLFAALCAQLIGGHRTDLQRLGLERQAVPYVKAIGQLVADLVESRSAAVRGQADPSSNLRISVTAVSDMDGQLGAALLTTERWAELEAAIDLVLADRPTGVAAADRYADLVTIAIDLMDAVATASMLDADPEPATRALIVSARELANLASATARAADASALAAIQGPEQTSDDDPGDDTQDGAEGDARPDSDAAAVEQVNLAVALHDAADAYRTLVNVLTASVDTGSRAPFTATVTEQLNQLHIALDPSVGPAALRAPSSADPATLDEVARQVRGLVGPATQTVLDELDGRLADREAALRGQLLLAVGLAAAGFVLGLVVLWWSAAPPAQEQVTDALVDGPDVASVSVQLPAVDARELLALEELVHVGRGVRGRPPGGDDDAE